MLKSLTSVIESLTYFLFVFQSKLKMDKLLYRKSKLRQQIYDLIKKSENHPTAQWLYNTLKVKISSLSLGTVYRNLNILIEQGLVFKLSLGDNSDRFDARMESHNHLICEKCGTVEDIFFPGMCEAYNAALKSKKFIVTRHKIDFYGTCVNCRENLFKKSSASQSDNK